MAIRNVLVHLDGPEVIGGLAPRLEQPSAARLPANWIPGFRLALAGGLVASAIWMLTIPLSPGAQT